MTAVVGVRAQEVQLFQTDAHSEEMRVEDVACQIMKPLVEACNELLINNVALRSRLAVVLFEADMENIGQGREIDALGRRLEEAKRMLHAENARAGENERKFLEQVVKTKRVLQEFVTLHREAGNLRLELARAQARVEELEKAAGKPARWSFEDYVVVGFGYVFGLAIRGMGVTTGCCSSVVRSARSSSWPSRSLFS